MPALTSTKNKTKDLTHGPIGRQLFWFSLPLFAGSLIQQLYSTVDLIFVGRVLGKDAAAAVEQPLRKGGFAGVHMGQQPHADALFLLLLQLVTQPDQLLPQLLRRRKRTR